MEINATPATSVPPPTDWRHLREERIINAAVRILDRWDQLEPEARQKIGKLAEAVGQNRQDRRAAIREALPQLTAEQRDTIQKLSSEIHDMRAERRAAIGERLSLLA